MRLSSQHIAATVLIVALAVAGCGRKGPLELPSAKVPDATTPSADTTPPMTPIPKQPAPSAMKQEAPKKPFFLDFLL